MNPPQIQELLQSITTDDSHHLCLCLHPQTCFFQYSTQLLSTQEGLLPANWTAFFLLLYVTMALSGTLCLVLAALFTIKQLITIRKHNRSEDKPTSNVRSMHHVQNQEKSMHVTCHATHLPKVDRKEGHANVAGDVPSPKTQGRFIRSTLPIKMTPKHHAVKQRQVYVNELKLHLQTYKFP